MQTAFIHQENMVQFHHGHRDPRRRPYRSALQRPRRRGASNFLSPFVRDKHDCRRNLTTRQATGIGATTMTAGEAGVAHLTASAGSDTAGADVIAMCVPTLCSAGTTLQIQAVSGRPGVPLDSVTISQTNSPFGPACQSQYVNVRLGVNPTGAVMSGWNGAPVPCTGGPAVLKSLVIDRPGTYTLVADGGRLASESASIIIAP
jgi:hypothetical protein